MTQPVSGSPLSPWDSSSSIDKSGLLHILDSREQLPRYRWLSRGSEDPKPECDQYSNTGSPSKEARVYLKDGTATNGALVWDKLILIQGPHDHKHLEHLWRIAAEREASAIVRLGPIIDYFDYFTHQKAETLLYGTLEVKPHQGIRNVLFDSTTVTHHSMEFRDNERSFPVYAVEEWQDFGTNQCPEIYRLLTELEGLEGPVIVHCRGGFGRTGTFAACWKIYQKYKVAKKQEPAVDIDPAAIVEKMRQRRANTVQTDEQFLMLLDFVKYLDSL